MPEFGRDTNIQRAQFNVMKKPENASQLLYSLEINHEKLFLNSFFLVCVAARQWGAVDNERREYK